MSKALQKQLWGGKKKTNKKEDKKTITPNKQKPHKTKQNKTPQHKKHHKNPKPIKRTDNFYYALNFLTIEYTFVIALSVYSGLSNFFS